MESNQSLTEIGLQAGLPITCSTCQHFYGAYSKGLEDCGKTTSCKGPLGGSNFPDYNGPIPRNMFDKICLVCGSRDILYHVISMNSFQKFALCDEHKKTFDYPLESALSMPLVSLIK